ncbi:hypothetical protein [Agromyces sp. PvR057]|uniref:hypothetical protein n=1 Tax=Agromyces sp. PvR057 TaxID=3156403 RepID=UPI00339A0EC4
MLVVALCGCTAGEGSTTDPLTARDELSALFDETQDLIDGDWTNEDQVVPLSCTTREGVDGVQFELHRTGPGTDDADAAARVADLWKANGYEILRTGDAGAFGFEVAAENPRRSSIVFTTTDDASILTGGSGCEPGDATDPRYSPWLTDSPSEPTD